MHTPWLAKAENRFYPQLQQDEETDVCVIGGGITGITTAFLLQEKGRRVILLERHSLATGVSGHTSGHMTSLVDTYYHKLVSDYSTDVARQVYEATRAARQTVERLLHENALEAGYQRTPAYYYATDDKQLEHLQKERRALEQMGAEVQDADDSVLPFAVKDIFKLGDQAVINAAMFVRKLAEVFVRKGGKIYEQTPALDFHRHDDFVDVETELYNIRARDVVQATHTPLQIHPIQLELRNFNSYVLAGPARIAVQEGLFYDFSQPYNYIRHYRENGQPMYIVGGFDTKTGTRKNELENLENLLQYASDSWGVEHAEYSWSSMFFAPSDGLPFIGKDPLQAHEYMASGFSGDGLTYGVVSAIVNSSLITTHNHPWKELFSPARFNLISTKDLLKKGVETLKFLVLERFQMDGNEMDEVRVGDGKIVAVDNHKLGVAVDENQEVHMVNPICSHMRCVVHWNNVSKTWDCGCHGSRFNIHGEVVSGPATRGLQKIEVEQKPDGH